MRLTANKGCGTSGTTLDLDMLEVRVSWSMATTTTTKQTLSVNDPVSGTPLASQGFWGAMFTSGGYRENGDKYGPKYLGNGTGQPQNSISPTYDASGYDYTIELPGGVTATCACSTRSSAPRATTGTAARSAPAITGPAARRPVASRS